MTFDLSRSIEILERTPRVLDELLRDLPDHWTRVNEGGETWSAYDVVGHLIHGERTDWMERLRKCLSADDKAFRKFDRTAMFTESEGRTLEELLSTFAVLRRNNLDDLRALNIAGTQFNSTGIHPAFGTVTLRQLLSTWVAHDLGHIAQIVRVMAKQYKEEVGPWKEYLRIVRD
jgi:DinB superfamily